MDELNVTDITVLELACMGFTNKEIAPRLGKTEFDVQYYKTRIVKKLKADSFYNAIHIYTKETYCK